MFSLLLISVQSNKVRERVGGVCRHRQQHPHRGNFKWENSIPIEPLEAKEKHCQSQLANVKMKVPVWVAGQAKTKSKTIISLKADSGRKEEGEEKKKKVLSI